MYAMDVKRRGQKIGDTKNYSPSKKLNQSTKSIKDNFFTIHNLIHKKILPRKVPLRL